MSAKRKPRDPYTTLGVARDASVKDVRSAYRRKAKRVHPDAGGDAAEFAELTKAHDLLLDPVRRLTYDTTGATDEAQPDNELAAAMTIINTLFDQVVENTENPASIDIVAKMRDLLASARHAGERKVHELGNASARTLKIALRIRRKSGNNFIKAMLDEKASAIGRQIVHVKAEIANLTRALALIDDFTFDFDRPSTQYMTINLQRSMFTTSASAV